ncbi:hypothetical protein [Candidatus Methanocrinis natronophilus]|uniref:Yip1 domain-containing protein n=1 Tax=Candidatus Methanocrinis natronophilus TaxID=3033396 RepID=A0ABT5X5X9_9EURY|nr:hypothetical protein [Candidatus Methanocrinis natronophilus]MDF0590108.1 hypothetical protein [Candidatus Methanocrinis natronophilus]
MSEGDSEPVRGGSLTKLDRFWLETARGAAKESVAALEEAAKQLISVTSLLQAIYFAAISFSDLKGALAAEGEIRWALVLLFVLPVVLWLLSLSYAVLVFKPESYRTNLSSPDLARSMYGEIVGYKHRQLQRAHLFLVLGFVPLVVNIVIYLAWI